MTNPSDKYTICYVKSDERRKSDVYYIKNENLYVERKILLKTSYRGTQSSKKKHFFKSRYLICLINKITLYF